MESGLYLQQELAQGNLGGDLALGPDLLSADISFLDNTVEGAAHVRSDLVLELDNLLRDHKGLIRAPDHKVGISTCFDGALDTTQANLAGSVEGLPLGQVLNTILSEMKKK